MPYMLMLYPPTTQVAVLPAAEAPVQVATTPGFQLAPNVDVAAVEQALMTAVPGQFVSVPIVYINQLTPVHLHVQPHLWAAWAIHYNEDPNDN